MKLCTFCQEKVLGSELSWDYHHGSYTSLEQSASFVSEVDPFKRERCLFCSTLKQDIDEIAPTLKDEKRRDEWPVYRWSIRSLARIRESLETVVVTFREIATINDSQDGKKAKEMHDDSEENKEDMKPLPTRAFYLFPEEALSPLPTPTKLGASTDPSKSGGHQIKAWLDICDKTHEDCQKRRKASSKLNSFLPTRLLDISGPPKSPIRVIETKTTPIDSPYCSLSHCWGLIKFVELTTSTYKEFTTEGVPWHLFTKNFQEAIEVARFLEISYIWIDSLCIKQGPDGDFGSEANKMHQVYRNSYCNIAIVDSEDSRGGLFRLREPEDVIPVAYKAEKTENMFGDRTWRVVPGDLWDRELLQTFLYRRGWVFQERMLAPRILHFARRQIFWDCPSMSACESLPAGLPQPMDGAAGPDRHWRGRLQEPEGSHEPLAGAIDSSLEYFWKTAVLKYTSCNLTKGRDKLIAMWGIAKLVRDALGVEYGDGLWEKHLEDQLAWRVAECTLDIRPSESTDESKARNIPSWSWASMDGAIEVPDRLTNQDHYVVKDHNNRPLAFDLIGVRRPATPKRGEQASPIQTRGMSDSAVELQKRYKELEKERRGGDSEFGQHHSAKIDRDAEPKFYSKCIPIQGHIGRGRLKEYEGKKKWSLILDGLSSEDIEVFPDTKPKMANPVDANPFFVVLSAKQVIKPVGPNLSDKNERTNHQENGLGEYAELEDGEAEISDFMVSGVGIILKDAGNDHFRRTGALYFRNVGPRVFEKLQETYGAKDLLTSKYDPVLGRKFWLD